MELTYLNNLFNSRNLCVSSTNNWYINIKSTKLFYTVKLLKILLLFILFIVPYGITGKYIIIMDGELDLETWRLRKTHKYLLNNFLRSDIAVFVV